MHCKFLGTIYLLLPVDLMTEELKNNILNFMNKHGEAMKKRCMYSNAGWLTESFIPWP